MSREQAVFEAAGVGHRITHEDDLPEAREVLPMVLEQIARPMALGEGGPSMVAKLTTQPMLQVEGEEAGECPDPTGTIEEGSPDTFMGMDKRAAAVVDEDMVVPCENCSDGPIATGAAHVFVNGKPWARRMDEIDCGAFVGEGEPTVLLGGEPSDKPGESRFDLDNLGRGKIPGGAALGVEYGQRLVGKGVVTDKLVAHRPTGADIGNHLAHQNQAGLIAMLTKTP